MQVTDTILLLLTDWDAVNNITPAQVHTFMFHMRVKQQLHFITAIRRYFLWPSGSLCLCVSVSLCLWLFICCSSLPGLFPIFLKQFTEGLCRLCVVDGIPCRQNQTIVLDMFKTKEFLSLIPLTQPIDDVLCLW